MSLTLLGTSALQVLQTDIPCQAEDDLLANEMDAPGRSEESS